MTITMDRSGNHNYAATLTIAMNATRVTMFLWLQQAMLCFFDSRVGSLISLRLPLTGAAEFPAHSWFHGVHIAYAWYCGQRSTLFFGSLGRQSAAHGVTR